ncbi:MAG: hypothetical protein ACLFUS_03630 [Candidatus Sumerlaeia bacterium]
MAGGNQQQQRSSIMSSKPGKGNNRNSAGTDWEKRLNQLKAQRTRVMSPGSHAAALENLSDQLMAAMNQLQAECNDLSRKYQKVARESTRYVHLRQTEKMQSIVVQDPAALQEKNQHREENYKETTPLWKRVCNFLSEWFTA